MAQYRRVTPGQAKQIAELEGKVGSKTLRTLLVTSESEGGFRLVSNLRLSRLSSGGGRLSEAEADRLAMLHRNTRKIEQLKKRGEKRSLRDFRINRAIRDWVRYGKKAGAKGQPDDDRLKATRALYYLGVDPQDGIFYHN